LTAHRSSPSSSSSSASFFLSAPWASPRLLLPFHFCAFQHGHHRPKRRRRSSERGRTAEQDEKARYYPATGGTQSNGLNHHRQPGIYGIRFKLAATEVSAVGAPPTHLHSSPFHSERRSQKISQQASRHVGATPAAFFNDRAAGERKSRRETLNERKKNYTATWLSAARIPIEREAY
jgi:hypothetical protein